jgi:hypothetical protein
MKKALILLSLMVQTSLCLHAQEAGVDSVGSDWSFSASAYYYIIPEEKNTVTAIGYADHKNWHFEARYNYEDRKTGSVFAGRRFEWGNKFVFGATPMVGFVFGNTNAFSPGIELDASYKIFDYYSETEYVIDFSGSENNFLYVWGEIGVTPFKSFRTGYSYQRTRLYQSQFDVQQGVFAEYQFWKITTGLYFFDPFSDSQFLIASLSFDF